jgi:hypothetical protein
MGKEGWSEVLTTEATEVAIFFQLLTQCSLVEVYQFPGDLLPH